MDKIKRYKVEINFKSDNSVTTFASSWGEVSDYLVIAIAASLADLESFHVTPTK